MNIIKKTIYFLQLLYLYKFNDIKRFNPLLYPDKFRGFG